MNLHFIYHIKSSWIIGKSFKKIHEQNKIKEIGPFSFSFFFQTIFQHNIDLAIYPIEHAHKVKYMVDLIK